MMNEHEELSSLPIEDIVSIQQLYARQSQAIDLGNPEEWAACFAPEGSFYSPFYGKPFTGRAELRDFAARFAENARANEVIMRHIINSLLIEPDQEGGATGRCYALMLSAKAGEEPKILRSSVFNDRLVKKNNRWFFQSREVVPDFNPATKGA